MRHDDEAVQLSGLTKRFGEVTAVDGLDLTIHRGEVVALLGPNGAGKSTTIDMLLGLLRPDAGRRAALRRGPGQGHRAGCGRRAHAVRRAPARPDRRETVLLAAALQRKPRPVAEVLERAGVAEFANQKVSGLSGGQQQRIRFAMALVVDPDLLVLDEPTTGMDVETRRAFWTSMREETARGRTVLFATHYLEEADDYADRIVLLRSGRVIADGTAAQIKNAVSGRTIRATIPGADLAGLAALPGVDRVETRGAVVLLHCEDSDTALRALLAATNAHDIEVVSRNLEDAFVALTTAGSNA